MIGKKGISGLLFQVPPHHQRQFDATFALKFIMNQEWNAEPAQIEAFINATNLVPVAMLDSVTDAVMCHLKDDARAEEIYEMLRGQETVNYIEGRSALVFANNEPFRKDLLVRDPRPTYRGFVQHWASSLIQKKFPVQFRKLPSGFATGGHL